MEGRPSDPRSMRRQPQGTVGGGGSCQVRLPQNPRVHTLSRFAVGSLRAGHPHHPPWLPSLTSLPAPSHPPHTGPSCADWVGSRAGKPRGRSPDHLTRRPFAYAHCDAPTIQTASSASFTISSAPPLFYRWCVYSGPAFPVATAAVKGSSPHCQCGKPPHRHTTVAAPHHHALSWHSPAHAHLCTT